LRGAEGRQALKGVRSRFRLLIIDEFQDTDDAQRDIAFWIAGIGDASATDGPQLFMVGDPKQSIYGFRGADICVWNEVVQATGKPLGLSHNFRSVPAIVGYVNQTCESVMNGAASNVGLESRVTYEPLVPVRTEQEGVDLEWLEATGTADERRKEEAEKIGARIREMVGEERSENRRGVYVYDPESRAHRPCEYRDMAILFRAKTGVELYTQALTRFGIPFYLAGDAALTEQLEILDLLNLFRLVANPQDDLAALTHLRSPYVGLRDETLARMRLRNRECPLLQQAERFARNGEWFESPEHPRISELERQSLNDGIALIRDLLKLRSRIPLDQLARQALERSGYPLHVLL
ncbi:MAG: UvrD-helicase domain-containing protein, partial [Candidatus Binatia bacterium]